MRPVVEKIAQRYRAERQRSAVEHVAPVVLNELKTAAAYIHDHPFGAVHGVYHPVVNKLRFLFLGKHAQFEAAGGIHFLEKALLVLRPAYGVRSHGINLQPGLSLKVLYTRRVPYPVRALQFHAIHRTLRSGRRCGHPP